MQGLLLVHVSSGHLLGLRRPGPLISEFQTLFSRSLQVLSLVSLVGRCVPTSPAADGGPCHYLSVTSLS